MGQMGPMGPMGPLGPMTPIGPMEGMPPYQKQQPSVPMVQPQTSDLPNDKEQLGEFLYPLVESIEPEYASKITGMLLEMEVDQIHSIILDKDQLKKWIVEAKRVLLKSK